MGSLTVLTMIVGDGGTSGGVCVGCATTAEAVMPAEAGCGILFCVCGFVGVVKISGGSGLLEFVVDSSLLVIVSHDAGGSPRELVVDRTSGEPRNDTVGGGGGC